MERRWVGSRDRPTFFSFDAWKTLIRLRLGRGDRVTFRQNIETEEVAGKIFQDRDLGPDATWWGCVADFALDRG
jgi:hypothetical protein